MRNRIAIGLLGISFVSWVAWGIYTIHHVSDSLTLPYAIGTTTTILGPLVVARVVLGIGNHD